MKTKLFFVLAAVSALLTFSCAKQDLPVPVNPTSGQWFRNEGLAAHYDTLQFSEKVAILGNLKQRDLPWVRARAGAKLVGIHRDADILVLDNSSVKTFETVLDSAYFKNKFIIIVNPDLESLASLRSKHGWCFTIPGETPNRDFAICFCRRSSYVSVAPVRIDSPIDTVHKERPYIIDIEGEEVYEGMSVFSGSRGLIGFIEETKKALSDRTKQSLTVGQMGTNTQISNYEHKYYNDEPIECNGGDTRYFRFFYEFKVKYDIYPCHVPANVSDKYGDYYVISATVSNYAPTAYEFDISDPERKSKSGDARYWTGQGDKSYWGRCQYRGPYNNQMKVKISAENDGIEFTQKGYPIPGTTVTSTTYSGSQTDSWSVGISGGASEGGGVSGGFNVGYGGSVSNSVTCSVPDVKVVNHDNGKSLDYEFNYQNLPTTKSDFDNYEPYMTDICKSTANFPIIWEWYCPMADGDVTIIPLRTEVHQYVDMWTRDYVNARWQNDIDTFHGSGTQVASTALNIVREPVGCLRINNNYTDKTLLYNVIIADENGNTVFSDSTSSFNCGECIEVLLPQRTHTYKVFLNAGKSPKSTTPYYSYNNKIKLPALNDPTNNNKVSLNISESGGDFESIYGVARVENQSSVRLIQNLTVRTADGAPVYCYNNPIGEKGQVDINLTAGQNYYITMEYGSSSQFDTYRTEGTFSLEPYSSEEDVRIFIATDKGGSFIKM